MQRLRHEAGGDRITFDVAVVFQHAVGGRHRERGVLDRHVQIVHGRRLVIDRAHVNRDDAD
jgi:hypothetical protein